MNIWGLDMVIRENLMLSLKWKKLLSNIIFIGEIIFENIII